MGKEDTYKEFYERVMRNKKKYVVELNDEDIDVIRNGDYQDVEGLLEKILNQVVKQLNP
jgi:uncharacterized beta-barrel protein YwiB (DUF1934 family)